MYTHKVSNVDCTPSIDFSIQVKVIFTESENVPLGLVVEAEVVKRKF